MEQNNANLLDDEKLEEEIGACQPFLRDTEMKNGRHKVFNFQMSKLDTKIIDQKFEEIFNKLNSAAKINFALRFVLRNVEPVEYRYCYALCSFSLSGIESDC